MTDRPETTIDLALEGAEATLGLGRRLGELLPPGSVLVLEGDLGTGKTTLARGIGVGLGIPEPVNSPTYILCQEYRGGRLPLFHFDAWMEGREKALLADGADGFFDAGGVALVEWGSRVAGWLPTPRLWIELGHATPETRRVTLTLEGDPGQGAELWDAVLGATRDLAAGRFPEDGLSGDGFPGNRAGSGEPPGDGAVG